MKKNYSLSEMLAIGSTIAIITSVLTFKFYDVTNLKMHQEMYNNYKMYEKSFENPKHKITINSKGDLTYFSKTNSLAFLDFNKNTKIDYVVGNCNPEINCDSLYSHLRTFFDIE